MNLFLEHLIPHPAIIDRLRTVVVLWPKVDELAPLNYICTRNPAIEVDMVMADEPWQIIRYPAILRALKSLNVKIVTSEDHLDELNAICEHLPEMTTMTLQLVSGLGKLRSCGHILARMDALDLMETLTTKEDIASLAELPKLSPGLAFYGVDLSISLLGSFVDSAIAATVFIMEDHVHVAWKKRNHRLKIICRFDNLPVLLDRAEDL